MNIIQTILNAATPDAEKGIGLIANIMLAGGIIFALLNCFLGYKLKKLWVTLAGFFIGFILGTAAGLILISSDKKTALALLIGCVCGIIIALIAFALYKAGLFLWCAAATFITVIGFFPQPDKWPAVVTGIIAALIVGILTIKFLRPVLIASTSINGGFSAMQPILFLCGVTNAVIVFAASVALSALGIFVQLKTTKAAQDKI